MISDDKNVSIKDIIQELDLDVYYMPHDMDYTVNTTNINRPGVQFAGFYDHFSYDRIQIIGTAEYAYFMSLPSELHAERLDRYMSYPIPLLVFTHGNEPSDIFYDLAKKHRRIIVVSEMESTRFINWITGIIGNKIAPLVAIHGVMIDIDCVGVLIKGNSSIGKSETAVELVRRGHRLVADDTVEIRKLEDGSLMCSAPELTRNYIELRGIGILDIKSLFGVGAVMVQKMLNLVVHLEIWDQDKYYDRLGLDEEYVYILNVPVRQITIPVRPGRNLAVILEIAARSFREKEMGYHAAKTFNEALLKNLNRDFND